MVESAGMDIYVRQKGIDGATISLQKLAKSADSASASNNKLTNEVRKTGTAMEAAKKVAAGYFTYAFVKRALDVADKMTSLRAQIQLVTSSQEEAIKVQSKLLDISNRTYASLEATTTLYTRTARALKDANKSQDDFLKFSEAINNAMRLGGVGANEQANALLQLSQALGSGVLQGDEFRSIAENAPILLDLVAKELGVVRGEVKQLASEGKVTSEVIFNAVTNLADQLAADAAKMPVTIAQALSVANNEMSTFTDTMLNGTGVTSYMADAIIALAKNIEFVLVPAVGVGAVMAFRTLAATLISLGAVGGPIAILVSAVGVLALAWDQNSRKLDDLNSKIDQTHQKIKNMTSSQLASHKMDIEIAINNDHNKLVQTKDEIAELKRNIADLERRSQRMSGARWEGARKNLDLMNQNLVRLNGGLGDTAERIRKNQELWKDIATLQKGGVDAELGGIKYSKEYSQILSEIEKRKSSIGIKTLEQTIELKLQSKEYKNMSALEKERLITEAATADMIALQAQNAETVTDMMEQLRIQAQKTGMGMREAFLFDLASKGAGWEEIEKAMIYLDHIANNTPSKGKSSIDHYNDRLQDMSRELSEIISLNKELEATGYTSQYNAVSRITLELNDQSSTLSKISEAQKQILIDQAQQIDNANQLNAILNFSNDYSRRFEDMEFELELMGKTKREIEGMRFAYELEKQAKQMSIGMSRANIETLKSETEEILKQHSAYRRAEAIMDGSYFEGIKTGFADYIDSVGNVREQTAGAITMTFGHLESQLVNFAQTSKFSFSDMTSSILQDLSKILIRMGMMNMVVAGFGENGTGGFFGDLFKGWGRFSDGGYTGHGGVHQPAGVVHKGEVVFSQRDIARLGGVGVVEGLRTSGRLPGYSNGGVVGAPPKFIPSAPNSQQGQQKSGDIVINQTIHYQGDKGEEDGKNAGQDFAAGFKTEVRRILADEKRPGGMLYR